MASIYRKSAPRTLAWLRFTVNQLRAGLHGLDIQYISPAHACMASIYSISHPNRLASIYRKSALQDFSNLVEGADGELWAEVAGER
mgnify:CR=1 FL=1